MSPDRLTPHVITDPAFRELRDIYEAKRRDEEIAAEPQLAAIWPRRESDADSLTASDLKRMLDQRVDELLSGAAHAGLDAWLLTVLGSLQSRIEAKETEILTKSEALRQVQGEIAFIKNRALRRCEQAKRRESVAGVLSIGGRQ